MTGVHIGVNDTHAFSFFFIALQNHEFGWAGLECNGSSFLLP